MTTQKSFQNLVEELPQRIISASGLTGLPATRQKKIADRVYERLFERWMNALLLHLSENDFLKIGKELEANKNLDESDMLMLLAKYIPHSEIILSSELENLFNSLTNSNK